MSYARDIVEGMARGLWLAAYSAYADLVRDPKNWPRAQNGQDWDDVAPETPDAAERPARELANLYTLVNGCSLDALYGKATLANGQDEDDSDQAYLFGVSLAMMALGSIEMNWFTDHARFDLKIPSFEITCDGDTLTWQGDASEPLVVNPGSPMVGPGWSSARERLRSAAAKKNGPKLFRHPEDPYAMRPSSGARATAKYHVLPGPRHGPTPRVKRPAIKRGRKRNPGESDLRFPLVCKHCKRAIAELRTEPGKFIDSTELSETCPKNGRAGHEPYGR